MSGEAHHQTDGTPWRKGQRDYLDAAAGPGSESTESVGEVINPNAALIAAALADCRKALAIIEGRKANKK